MTYSKQEALDSLREATNQLGHSPTQSEYRSLGLTPSVSVFGQSFEGWNQLKEEANLNLCEAGPEAKYDVNENYFESIDSSEKAYWLGMLFGDGWYTQSTGVIGLGLQEKAHIERFAEAIESEHTVEKTNSIYRIRIRRSKLAEDLDQYGFNEHKTDSAALPALNQRFQPHFVRGLSDADGSFAENTDCHGFTWRIAGNSKERFEKLANWLPVEAPIYPKAEGSYILQVANQEGIHRLVEWMYPEGVDTTPSLPRKTALAHY